MKKVLRKRIFGFSLITLSCLLLIFIPGQALAKLKVMASLFPLQEFAQAVGGERIDSLLLLPPGVEPHTWEPKPSDGLKISRADIFVYIGPAMEPWVDKVLKAAKGKNLRLVEATHDLPLLNLEPGEIKSNLSRRPLSAVKTDPHVWLDFDLDLKIVDKIAAAFSEKDPAQASYYHENASIYKTKLKDLDQKYQRSLAHCRHRHLILGGHAAFAYLAKRYGLKQMALSGISPNAEPTPKRMAEVIAATKKEGIRFIYAEEMVNPKLAQALAKEAGVQILLLNPGGNLTREQMKQKVTFLDLMEKNLKNLRQGLECRQEPP